MLPVHLRSSPCTGGGEQVYAVYYMDYDDSQQTFLKRFQTNPSNSASTSPDCFRHRRQSCVDSSSGIQDNTGIESSSYTLHVVHDENIS